jgi:hypothetical protein
VQLTDSHQNLESLYSVRPANMRRMSTSTSLTIRLARPVDAAALAHIATLDSAPAPRGEGLLPEADGKPVAAVSVTTGHAVADPFVATAEAVAVLRLRAAQLRAPGAPRRPLLRRAGLRVASG